MKINTDQKEQEVGFKKVEPGEYIAQIQEGIMEYENENTGSISIGIPMQMMEVWTKGKKPGSEDSVTGKFTRFLPLKNVKENKIHEGFCGQLEALIVFAGLADEFVSKFVSHEDLKSMVANDFAALVEWLKWRLPDHLIGVELMTGKNFKTGDEETQLKKWWAVSGKGKPSVSEPEAADSGDWD